METQETRPSFSKVRVYACLFVFSCITVITILFGILGKQITLAQIELWRICGFVSTIPVIYGITYTLSFVWEIWVDSKLINDWLFDICSPVNNIIRVITGVLTTISWDVWTYDKTHLHFQRTVLRLLCCVTLFSFACLTGSSCAKWISGRYCRSSQYKLKDTSRIDNIIKALVSYTNLNELEKNINSQDEVARQILAKCSSNGFSISYPDLVVVLGESYAGEAIAVIDSNNDHYISLKELSDALKLWESDKKSLMLTLNAAHNVTNVLRNFISGIVNFIMIFVYLYIFDADVYKIWLTASGLILAFSFVFGGTVRDTFSNAVFLFSVHPFDIKDVIQIDNDVFIVEELSLFFTVLQNKDGRRAWYINTLLQTKIIYNISRSK